MLHRISGEFSPPGPRRPKASGDEPLVVVVDQRMLIGQCTAVGLQDADARTRFQSCGTVGEWMGRRRETASLLLLSGTPSELDREIALLDAFEAAPPFAILSGDTDDITVDRYLSKGARGYIATSQPRTAVLAALRRITAGQVVVPARRARACDPVSVEPPGRSRTSVGGVADPSRIR